MKNTTTLLLVGVESTAPMLLIGVKAKHGSAVLD
jgi:hypothetical protein